MINDEVEGAIIIKEKNKADTIEIALFKNDIEVPNSRKQQQLDAVFQTPTSPMFNVSANVSLTFGNTIDVRMRNVSNPTSIIATDVVLLGGTNA